MFDMDEFQEGYKGGVVILFAIKHCPSEGAYIYISNIKIIDTNFKSQKQETPGAHVPDTLWNYLSFFLYSISRTAHPLLKTVFHLDTLKIRTPSPTVFLYELELLHVELQGKTSKYILEEVWCL